MLYSNPHCEHFLLWRHVLAIDMGSCSSLRAIALMFGIAWQLTQSSRSRCFKCYGEKNWEIHPIGMNLPTLQDNYLNPSYRNRFIPRRIKNQAFAHGGTIP